MNSLISSFTWNIGSIFQPIQFFANQNTFAERHGLVLLCLALTHYFWAPFGTLALALEEKIYLIVAAICGGLCHICPISSVFSRLEGPGLLFLVWKWFQTLLIISQPLPVLLSIAEKDLEGSAVPRAFQMQTHCEFMQWHWVLFGFFCPPFLISSNFQIASAHCWVELCASIPTSPFVL